MSSLIIASDHAGFALKEDLIAHLTDKGQSVRDLGPSSDAAVDYPEYAHAACFEILAAGSLGILVCGTGIGMSIAANRHPGIRAALCTYEFQARAARQHNNANILCLAARVSAPPLARTLVDAFLAASFTGGRHQRRLALIDPA
ncbi:MAG: ribose 5-phosphate isomerase B [Desulfovibrio sp.]|nr:ribose 5-phosphate isomerase B [Desulfovibrio sp.]